jgi:hypothetical protein
MCLLAGWLLSHGWGWWLLADDLWLALITLTRHYFFKPRSILPSRKA